MRRQHPNESLSHPPRPALPPRLHPPPPATAAPHFTLALSKHTDYVHGCNRLGRSGGMADAPDSKSGALTGIWVQVPSPVPFPTRSHHCGEVPEWTIGRAWRARALQKGAGGSNPSLSAIPPPVAALAERRGCSVRVQGSGKTQKPVNAKVANAAKDSQTLKPKKQFRSVAALAERRGCSVPLRTHAPAGASTIPLATPSVPSLNPSPPSLPAPCVKWLFGFP